MKGRRRPLTAAAAVAAVALVAVVVAVGGGNHSRAVVTPRPQLFGVNGSSYTGPPQAAAERLTEIHANVIRIGLNWDLIQAVKGDALDWAEPDKLIDVLPPGVRVLALPLNSPAWARGPAGRAVCTLPGESNPLPTTACRMPPDRAHLKDWRAFIAAIVRRYRDRLAAIEVWNEPNWVSFWRPRVDGAHWAHLVAATARVVDRAAPGLPIVTGGILGATTDDPAGIVSPGTFLRDAFEAEPRLGSMIDGIGVHPYSHSVSRGANVQLAADDPDSTYSQAMSEVRAARDKLAAATPVWITEFGYHTAGAGAISEEDQARWLRAAYEGANLGGDVRAFIIHTLFDTSYAPSPEEQTFGLLRADNTPKPAFDAFARP